MLSIFKCLFKILFKLFRTRRSLVVQITILEKELNILNRKNQKKRLIPEQADRIILVIMNLLFNIKNQISVLCQILF